MKLLFLVLCTLSSFLLVAQEWTPDPATPSDVITRSGKVGIGTSSPGALLSVGGAGNSGYTGYFYRPMAQGVNSGMAVYGKVVRPTAPNVKTTGLMGYAIAGVGTTKGVAGHSSRLVEQCSVKLRSVVCWTARCRISR